MKVAAIVLGIIGALFGFFGAIFALGLGGLGGAFGAEGAESISRSGIIAILASIVGLVGAVLVFKKSWLAGWLMVGAAVVGFVATFVAYIIGGIFLLIAGIMALTIKEKGGAEPAS